MDEYNEDNDAGSELEDNEIDIDQINDRINDNDEESQLNLTTSNNFQDVDFDDIYRSVLNGDNDEEILRSIEEDNHIYSKEGRPYVDFCNLNYSDFHIPINNNQGELNYENLPANLDSLEKVFKLFISEEILNLIVYYTNLHSENQNDEFRTSTEDLLTFISILIYQGAHKDNQIPIANLWSSFNSKAFYYATSSRKMFEKNL